MNQVSQQTLLERRLERNFMYRMDHKLVNALRKTKSYIVEKYEHYLNEEYEEEKTISVLVLVKGGEKIRVDTNEYEISKAKKQVDFLMEHIQLKYGEPIAWAFEGENVFHSVQEIRNPSTIKKVDLVIRKLFSLE